MNALRDALLAAHRPSWKPFWTWIGFFGLLIAAQALLFWTVYCEHYWLAAAATLLVAHLMHSSLLAFHEAAHGVLCPTYGLNEAAGILLGNLHFNSLSLFRAVHHTHHQYLATERDEELWPFVDTATPRWKRIVAAMFELSFGLAFDAIIFWRAFLRRNSSIANPGLRRRIWIEAALMVSSWMVVLGLVARFGMWMWLFVLFLIPAIVAGDMHSFRKYVEHIGLTGSGIKSLTRSVVPTLRLGRLIAFTMFNISYHTVHHRYGRMPETSLPQFADTMQPSNPDEVPVYPTYWAAFCAMLPTLTDPRVGPQWRERGPTRRHEYFPLVAETALRLHLVRINLWRGSSHDGETNCKTRKHSLGLRGIAPWAAATHRHPGLSLRRL